MKSRFLIIALAACSAIFAACDDDTSEIGSSLSQGSLSIRQDTLKLEVPSSSVATPVFDGRSASHLLGRLSSEQYGDLSCSFVSRLMSASSMDIPDSIGVERIDSVKMIFSMPRGQFTGDSLAPQQLSVYKLIKQLPDKPQTNFNPDGYYNASSLLGQRTYTLSELTPTDTVSSNLRAVRVDIPMPISLGKEVFNTYRTKPEVFAWPSEFAKFFPGIYVTRTFGSGCIANVSKVEFMLYYYTLYNKTTVENGVSTTRQIHLRDSVAVFATAPEVLSSNNITFNPASYLANFINRGETIIVSPGGYNAKITFPAQTVVDKYRNEGAKLAVVSALTLTIPASTIANDLGIAPPPNLLMVKTSELEEFFAKNKIPDNKTSFWASYNESKGIYEFNNLRDYITPMLESGEVDPDNTEFTLVPVTINYETYTQNSVTYNFVTRCSPYVEKPAMVRLNTSDAYICFTFTLQQLK